MTFDSLFVLLDLLVAPVQTTPPPLLHPGEPVRGTGVACYALETPPRSQWTVTLQGQGFAPELWVSRGALCQAVTNPQHRAVAEPGGSTASLTFTSPGGRYIVLVRGTPASGGQFELMATPPQADPTSTASPPIVLADSTEDLRLARMRREIAAAENRNRREEEARQRRVAEERRAAEAAAREDELARERSRQYEAEREAGEALVFGAILGAIDEVATTYAETQAETAAFEARVEAENARIRRAEEEARAERAQEEAARAQSAQDERTRQAAEMERRRAQQAAEQAARQETRARQAAQLNAASADGSGAGSGGTGGVSARPAPATIAMREGVVVCPTDGSRLFGEMMCHGPFQSGLSNIDRASDIALACGSGGSTPRDYGMYGRYRVWGCGYGVNPRRSGSPNIDQAERYGLIVPPRRTYHCLETISGYCR